MRKEELFLLRFIQTKCSRRSNINNNRNEELGYYLAGLIESDGSIIIPKKNSNNSPIISITFHINEKPLAECLIKRINSPPPGGPWLIKYF